MANTEKFLNSSGLSALWAKIKSKFYTKAEVDALIPEDEVMIVNITKDNGTYSSNKTYAEMASFIRNGGKTIIAQYRSEKYPLVHLDDNGGESDIYGEIDFGYINFSPHYEETPTEIYENVLFSTGFYIDNDNNIEFFWEPIVAASDSNPLMDGVAAIGTSNQYARADHVHPTDTSRAAVADVLTKTNTTSYTPTANYHPATKKYVDDAVAAAAPTCATTAEIEEMCDALGFYSVTIDTSDYEERSNSV